VRPTPVFLAWLGIMAALGVAVVCGWLTLTVFAIAWALLLIVAVIDALRLHWLPAPSVERVLPAIVPVGVERAVSLRIRNSATRAVSADVHDLHPGDWPVLGLPRRVDLPPQRELELPYRITPSTRGRFRYAGCALRLASPWRLWRQQRIVAAAQEVRVYPNFAPLTKLALVGAEQASRVVGAHLRRRRGEGTEFQQLREYRLGDTLRQIDWKATQRARKLISRDYQDERNQQVMLLIDTGRRMLARDDTLSHFDHVLNAALLVAYIALRQGDAVGLLAAGGESRFIAPRRGLGTVDALLNGVFDLDASAVATDYLEAATLLGARQSRRCLVLLITNARDEDIDDLLGAVRLLQRRHLVCVASLREAALDQSLRQTVAGFDDALALAATAQYVEQRSRTHALLRAQCPDLLDVTCAQLPAALVEHYLAMKRAARL
jgi:uncharacterized protein (DUF58 family)